MKKTNTALYVFLGLLLAVMVPVGFIIGFRNSIDYIRNGTEVECTVVAYEKFGKQVDVQVEYYDEDDNCITADCIYNKPSPYLGEKLTCYVMDDDPHNVYNPPSALLMVVCGAVVLIFVALGIIIIVGAIVGSRNIKLLEKNGVYADGEVIEVTMMKDPNGKMSYPAKMKYTDSDGVEHIDTFLFERRPPDIGEIHGVRYAKKANGKTVSELTRRQY